MSEIDYFLCEFNTTVYAIRVGYAGVEWGSTPCDRGPAKCSNDQSKLAHNENLSH